MVDELAMEIYTGAESPKRQGILRGKEYINSGKKKKGKGKGKDKGHRKGKSKGKSKDQGKGGKVQPPPPKVSGVVSPEPKSPVKGKSKGKWMVWPPIAKSAAEGQPVPKSSEKKEDGGSAAGVKKGKKKKKNRASAEDRGVGGRAPPKSGSP